MYKGEADWSLIADVKNNSRMHIPVFGNGDINTPEKAVEYKNKYGVDGVMIGRASIGNPWIFREIKHFIKYGTHHAPPNFLEKVEAVIEHLQTSIDWKGEKLGIAEMKRHYSNYFKGVTNFKETKTKLVTSNDLNELYQTLADLKESADTYEFSNSY